MARRVLLLGALIIAGPAHADGPITNRDYAIDLYDGVAIGDTRQIGMGGTGAALLPGSAGALINPSAPGIRPDTDTDNWSWDFYFDFLTSKYSSDYDNNGTVANDNDGAFVITAGASIRVQNWSFAATIVAVNAPIASATPEPEDDLDAGTARGRVVLAKWIPQLDISLGIGAQFVGFAVNPQPPPDVNGMPAESPPPLFEISGSGFLGGITVAPLYRNFRVAAAYDSKIVGAKVTSRCNADDPADCMGYILPRTVVSPSRVVVGAAYRFSPTQWNQLVGGHFRDETSVTLAADVLVTGSSPNAYGLEAFAEQRLQRSGRHNSVSVRVGGEYECLPGRLRLRAGSYWEPKRFVDQGGRLHVTAGVELRVLEFNWRARPRRGRISLTADVASDYRNLAVSVGFWH